MMTEEMLEELDENFIKARMILITYLEAHQDDSDHTTVIEVAMDYMNKVNTIISEAK